MCPQAALSDLCDTAVHSEPTDAGCESFETFSFSIFPPPILPSSFFPVLDVGKCFLRFHPCIIALKPSPRVLFFFLLSLGKKKKIVFKVN